MGGGGGVSGAVDFPDYIKNIHEDWLYGAGPSGLSLTIEDAMDTAFAADPYAAFTYTNPTTDLTAVGTLFNTYLANVTSLAPTTDFASLLDQAVAKADECDIDGAIDVRTLIERQVTLASGSVREAVSMLKKLIDGNVIEGIVTAFEIQQSIGRAKRVARFSAGMADIGAIHSSSFLMGLGLIYAQEQQETADFSARLNQQMFEQGLQAWTTNYRAGLQIDLSAQGANKDARTKVVLTGLDVLQRFLLNKSNLLQTATQLKAEITNQKIIARGEYEESNLQLDINSALWDLDIFGRGMALVGGISGYAHPLPKGPNKIGSALGGALKGAGAGASVGTALAPITGGLSVPIGAGIGALLGGIGGLFS